MNGLYVAGQLKIPPGELNNKSNLSVVNGKD